ncbi:MAG TPA: winged helix DNA-binding domain-containing protein [Propionibacteriaceae bacterium]|nr:winged helix DNA-binding domain-containing protein [Propionibacteriaceae bacterium]
MGEHIDAEERRARLAERHRLLPRTRTDNLPDIADDVVALHSSDPVSVFLSAMARMAHPSIEAVERALYADRSLVRHHGMRRTLWVATPSVVRLMHAAATRDLLATERRRTAQLLAASGVADPEQWLAEAEERVIADLREHGPSTAREIGQRGAALRQRLHLAPGKAYAAVQSAHTRVLYILGFDGKMLRGQPSSWINGAYRYVDAESWLPGGLGDLDPRQAAAELADRWLQRFGPATTFDLQWWMGWTVARTKQALADCGAVEAELDSGAGWLAADDPPLDPVEPWVAVLPGLDPTIMGWKQRDWYLPSTSAEVFDSAGNGGPSLWVDGRVVGAWAQTKDGMIHTHYFERVAAARRREIDQRIGELKSWIGDTRFTVRFPGDIHARLLGTRTVPGYSARRPDGAKEQ